MPCYEIISLNHMETVQGSKIVTEKQSNKLNNRLMEKILSRLIKSSTNQNSQCMSQNNLIFNILLPPLEVWFIHVSSDLHSTCPAKTQSTSSITPSCPTIPRSQSETSRSTTPSAACTEQPTWSTTRSSAKGKHRSRTRGDRSHSMEYMCILTQ